MKCPRCGSENVSYQVDSKVKHSFWWVFKGKTTTYAVCQNCGKRWKRNPFFEKPTYSNTQGHLGAQVPYGQGAFHVQGVNMFCTNCGAQISGGNFCPRCGCPIQNAQTYSSTAGVRDCNLSISRTSRVWLGMVLYKDIKVKVFIDGERKGSLRDGETLKYRLSEGTHTILLTSYLRPDVTVPLNIGKQSYQITCAMKSSQLEYNVSVL